MLARFLAPRLPHRLALQQHRCRSARARTSANLAAAPPEELRESLRHLRACLLWESEKKFTNYRSEKVSHDLNTYCAELLAQPPLAAQRTRLAPRNGGLGFDEALRRAAGADLTLDQLFLLVYPSLTADERKKFISAVLKQLEALEQPAGAERMEQGGEEWKAARRKLLTASDFGAAVGVRPQFASKYPSRVDLFLDKVGIHPAPFNGNDHTDRGHLLEPYARALYTVWPGRGCVVTSDSLGVHATLPWLGASPDGLVAPDGLLEIKCPARGLLAAPHDYYMTQVQGQMEVYNREWCHFLMLSAGTNGNFEWRMWELRRDRAFWAAMVDVMDEFWHGHVLPARAALEAGATAEEVQRLHAPAAAHARTAELAAACKRLAAEAVMLEQGKGLVPMAASGAR